MPGKYSVDSPPWAAFANRRTMLTGLGMAGLSSIGASAPHSTIPSIAPLELDAGEISVTKWGVRGGNDPSDTGRIQRALDEAPIGCSLIFPTGYYRVNRQLNVRRKLNLVGRGAIISGELSVDDDLFSINIEDEGNRDNRVMVVTGFRIWMNKGGKNCIAVYNKSPNVANMGMVIENNILGVLPGAAGHAVLLQGVGTHFNVIRNCQIENGILLACADGSTVEGCVIFGEKPAITLDLVPGAFQTHIINNGLVSRDGALFVKAGSQVLFSGNQIEQFATGGVNQSREKTSLYIAPESKNVRSIRIIGNNFGGGTNVNSSIVASGDCQDLYIDQNVFGTTGSGADIFLSGNNVAWTRIGPNNTVRGPARGQRGANSVRPIVDDTARGTFGIRKSSGALMRRGEGWLPTSDFSFCKDLGGVVRFEGGWRAGAVAPGTLVAVLPEGFRPSGPAFLHCGSDAIGETAVLRVDADGAIRVHHAPSATIYAGGASFSAADREAYPPSDP